MQSYTGAGGEGGVAYLPEVALDGLFWPVAEGDEESPFGPLYADAAGEQLKDLDLQTYHGYCFRILEGQGKNAPGGECSFPDRKGSMSRFFAAIARPAKYDNSGIMILLVNRQWRRPCGNPGGWPGRL